MSAAHGRTGVGGVIGYVLDDQGQRDENATAAGYRALRCIDCGTEWIGLDGEECGLCAYLAAAEAGRIAETEYEQRRREAAERRAHLRAISDDWPDEDDAELDPEIVRSGVELDRLLSEEDVPYDWLVPGLIERGDRLILTGLEGGGKSTLLRQLAVQFACGVHPFGGADFTPVSTLVVDVENSRRQVRRKVRPLRDAADGRYDPVKARVAFEFVPDLNLLAPGGAAWLDERLVANGAPDVLMIGPVYKLAKGDPTKEETALAVASAIDRVRATHGCAVVMEAHTPYADSSKSKRPVRPYGASLWSRWPEFGIYISPEGKVEHWRGPRDEREWPKALERGAPWPWMPADSVDDIEEWHGPTQCMAAVLALLTAAAPAELSVSSVYRDLVATGSKFRRETVLQAAAQLHAEGRVVMRHGPRNAQLYSVRATLS
jgi:hypothetical protein